MKNDSDLQIYRAKNIEVPTFHECCPFFRRTIYHAINFHIINLFFVFILLLTERQKFTFHSSSRKNTKLYKPLQNVFFFFCIRTKYRKKFLTKLHFSRFLQLVVVTQCLHTKTTFLGSSQSLTVSVTVSQSQYSFS